MSISIIYARSLNHCIGRVGGLPWDLPEEFKHFNRTTMGHSIVMGRRSYEDHQSNLAGRLNIVVSSNRDYQLAKGVRLADSLQGAIQLGFEYSKAVFVIGGVELIVAAMNLSDTTIVYESIVDTHCDGDTFLPAFDFSHWESTLISRHAADTQHAFGFEVWQRKRIT